MIQKYKIILCYKVKQKKPKLNIKLIKYDILKILYHYFLNF